MEQTTLLNCKKCNGNIFHDNMYDNGDTTELYCLQCGKRWKLKNTNKLVQWLNRKS